MFLEVEKTPCDWNSCVQMWGSNLENGNLPLQPFLLVGRDASLVKPLAEALSLEALGGLEGPEQVILALRELVLQGGLRISLSFRHGGLCCFCAERSSRYEF